VKRDRSVLRVIHAVDDVQHRALARAVGADDRAHLVLADIEADIGQCLHAPECQRNAVELQDDLTDATRAHRTPTLAASLANSAAALPPKGTLFARPPHRFALSR